MLELDESHRSHPVLVIPGRLRPRRAVVRFTKSLWLGEVLLIVVGALVGEDERLLSFQDVALPPVGC